MEGCGEVYHFHVLLSFARGLHPYKRARFRLLSVVRNKIVFDDRIVLLVFVVGKKIRKE